MEHFQWRLVGFGCNGWINHLHPKDFGHPNLFTSVCGKRNGALNGENSKYEYCSDCATKAVVLEKEEKQKREDEIRRKEEEKQEFLLLTDQMRPEFMRGLHAILNEMSSDKLAALFFALKEDVK